MPSIITINGSSLADLGLGQPLLQKYNQQADTLSLTQLTAPFDAAPLFPYNSRVVAKSGSTIIFTGMVVEMPRRLAIQETITYVAHGPWQWLSTYHYLQTYQIANDPTLDMPTLVATYMGRVVIGQAPDGTRQNLGAALQDIVNFAIANGCPILLGSISGFDFQVPWDQVSDINCADAITRLLQSWAPDAVVVWDYTTTNPTINIKRRASLPAVSLSVAPVGTDFASVPAPAYVPFESIDLTPLYKDLASCVVLFFPKINTAGGDSWVTLEVDKYPGTATGKEARALVRTIELTGYRSNILTQKVKVLPLATALGVAGTGTDGLTSDPTLVTEAIDADAFKSLKDFWTRKLPALAQEDVVIKGFKNRIRKAAPATKKVTGVDTQYVPDLDTTLTNELVEGAVADWMIESTLNRKAQEQNYECRIAYSVKGVDQKDADGMGVVIGAGVMATNCSTRTYTQETDVELAEDTPTGLAAQIFTAVGTLHYAGSLTIIAAEASFLADVGNVVNLSGGLGEWGSMNALVQEVQIDFDQGRSTLKVGPPAQLGADSLAALYRVNRTRRDVTVATARVTGLG